MQEKFKDYEYCVSVALKNAKKRLSQLDDLDCKCVMEEYKEWLNDGVSENSVLLLREDPII